MKKKVVAKAKRDGLAPLIAEVRNLIQSARRGVASVVDTFQVMTNFEIGRRIVEHEQNGAKRAEYGTELLKELSARLTAEFGKGFSERNLRSFRSFFLTYRERVPQIWQQPAAKLMDIRIQQTPSVKLTSSEIAQKPTGQFSYPFTLSWTHYVELLSVKDPGERSAPRASAGKLMQAVVAELTAQN
jgi:hypothetical protein